MAQLKVQLAADGVYEAAHSHLPPRQRVQRHGGKIIEIAEVDTNGEAGFQIQPKGARRLTHAQNPGPHYTIAACSGRQIGGGNRLIFRSGPEAAACHPRAPFSGRVTVGIPEVGRQNQQGREPLIQQPGRNAPAIIEKSMGKAAAVDILKLGVVAEPDARAGGQTLAQSIARRDGKRLIRAAVASEFRRIHADEAEALTVAEKHRVPVMDIVDPHRGVYAVGGAVRLG